jgi:hypothetical protein
MLEKKENFANQSDDINSHLTTIFKNISTRYFDATSLNSD